MKHEFPLQPRACLAAGVAALALATAPASFAQAPAVMKLSTPTVNDTVHQWMKDFKAGVEARANGRLKVEIYVSNQLGAVPRTVEGVALGTVELAFVPAGYGAPYDPRFEALETTGLFKTLAQANRVLMDEPVRKRIATYGQTKSMEPLLCVANGPMAVTSRKAIRNAQDFAGLKVRTAGTTPQQVNPLRQLGASPVAMPVGESLSAVQNRTIDAVMAAPALFLGFKYYDVTHYMTILPQSYLIACALTSRTFLQGLGPELEKTVREEALKAQVKLAENILVDADAGRKAWQQAGGELIDFNPADAQRYLDTVQAATAQVSGGPTLRPEIELLKQSAARMP